MTEVRTWPSCYSVSAHSDADGMDGSIFEIQVERAVQMDGSVKWAVRWMGRCLHRSGRWDWEPQPSSRTDRWLASHRFDEATAMKLATNAAPLMVVNGYRPDGTRVSP